MKSELIPLNGDAPVPITRDVTVVGRREYCDVVVPHPSLSKRHCVLVRTDGLLIVRDLISTNGTKVNGQRVMWAALLPNDKLTLGRVKYKVYLGPDDQLSPSELGRRSAAEFGAGIGPMVAAAGIPAVAGFAAPSPPQFPAQPAGDDPLPEFAFELDDSDDLPGGLELLDAEPPVEPYAIELDD